MNQLCYQEEYNPPSEADWMTSSSAASVAESLPYVGCLLPWPPPAPTSRDLSATTQPEEYLPNLSQIIRLFRESVALKPAEASFQQGWQEAQMGQTRPVSELWNGIDAG